MTTRDQSSEDSAPTDTSRAIARSLLDMGAVSLRPEAPFTLTSGKPSPVYVDCRRIISFSAERGRIIDAAVAQIDAHIGRSAIDAVAGGETAGIPYAAWLADRLDCPMLYVRKKPKGFGRNAQIEGVVSAGARVLLAEDMTTDGGSKMVFIDALRQAGAVVSDCWVTFRYGPAANARLAATGVRLLSLASWADIIDVAREDGRITPDLLSEVESFLADPARWQAHHMEAGT